MYVLEDSIDDLRSYIKREVEFTGPVAQGQRGKAAARTQEWLCLHHRQVVVDGDFGPVSTDALMNLQTDFGVPVTGVVDEQTHALMVEPMLSVLRPPFSMSMPFSDAVLAVANAHLAQHPREVGGDNRGPWVRIYMNGNDGANWFWCAGFVKFCMLQAAELLDVDIPIAGSFSCDSLAAQARDARLFLAERDAEPDNIPPGSIFLVRRTPMDWTHTGIVSEARDNSFGTVEGNTNDDGYRNGYEVCSRSRGYSKKDFIIF